MAIHPVIKLLMVVGCLSSLPLAITNAAPFTGEVAVGDPNNPQNVIKPNADGSINTENSGGANTPTNPSYVAPGTGAVFPTTTSNPSSLYSNQQALTTTAAALPTQALSNGVTLVAPNTNTGTIYFGPSGVTSSTGTPLQPGMSASVPISQLANVYVLDAVTTDKVAFFGN